MPITKIIYILMEQRKELIKQIIDQKKIIEKLKEELKKFEK